MVEIRKAEDGDKPAIWQIIKAVIAGGDTYVFSPDTIRRGDDGVLVFAGKT